MSDTVRRDLAADPALAATVQRTVEETALARGLDASGAARLGQAVEEVFVFVATRARGSSFALEVRDRRHALEVRLACRLPASELHWFNITQPIDVADASALEALELLLASRLVDRLSVALDRDGGAVLILEQQRQYAMPEDAAGAASGGTAAGAPEPADAATLPALARLFRRRLGIAVPAAFQADGLALDLAAAGELSALVTRDAAGEVVGGVAWTARSPRLVEMLGPVTLGDDAAAAGRLVIALAEALAATEATALVSEERGTGFPVDELDALGRLGPRPLHYRALRPDAGALAWVDPASRPFLAVLHEQLGLQRELRDAPPDGDRRLARALLAADIDRIASRVTLRPLVDGADMPALIAAHVDRFAAEGLDDFRFETDHGEPWQARLGQELLRTGFAPRVMLPGAGKGDVLVWERDWMAM
ncbi:MAG: hypothetical protein IT561_23030 [Alphaproteobacteria bacterium]|nr:hypothetical protein [Alphaproteobacteria bacterium]